MLSIKVQRTPRHAQMYFQEHLRVGDYHADGEQVPGVWFGKGAEQLRVEGRVEEEAFLNLLQGLHPHTGEKLTQRLKAVREGPDGLQANRRLFYDFCFSPPKSVSIVAQLCDPGLIEDHPKAVTQALKLLEDSAATRVRKHGACKDRLTQNIVAACFQHDTSRSLDPHLHTHCVVLNITYDPHEQKWKALQTVYMLQVQKAAYACYLNTLSLALQERGYSIERNARDFEIKGVSSKLIKTFSKRHDQIEALYQTEKKLSKNQHLKEKDLKERLAYTHRDRKLQSLQKEELHKLWKAQLTPADEHALSNLRYGEKNRVNRLSLEEAFEQAESTLFERATFSTQAKILAEVGYLTLDSTYTWEAIEKGFESRGYLKDPFSERITLPAILERSKQLNEVEAQRKKEQKRPSRVESKQSSALKQKTYEQAVQAAAQGEALQSLHLLDTLGCIQRTEQSTMLKQLAEHYTAALRQSKNCLAISQNNEAVTQLNFAIKEQLKQEGRLGAEHPVRLFAVQDVKRDSAPYTVGDYAFFHRKYGSLTKGDLLPIVGKTDTHLLLEKADKEMKVSLKYGDYFNTCTAQDQLLAEGEALQVKFNGTSQDGKIVHNGERVTFLGLEPSGNLKVQDAQGFEKTLAPQQAIFQQGYAVTSCASQGKPVDQVFICDSDSENSLAVHRQEWYASLSRSKEPPMLYTSDKEALFENILQFGERGLALELESEAAQEAVELYQQEAYLLEADQPDWAYEY